FKEGLYLNLDGNRLALRTLARDVLFSPGAGGLPTMKLGFVYHASLDAATPQAWRRLDYRDLNFPDRVGWKEVAAVAGPGVAPPSRSGPEAGRRRGPAGCPADMLDSPAQ